MNNCKFRFVDTGFLVINSVRWSWHCIVGYRCAISRLQTARLWGEGCDRGFARALYKLNRLAQPWHLPGYNHFLVLSKLQNDKKRSCHGCWYIHTQDTVQDRILNLVTVGHILIIIDKLYTLVYFHTDMFYILWATTPLDLTNTK